MTDRMKLLEEANRRGLLQGQQKTLFDEAVRRGLISQPQQVEETTTQGGMAAAFGSGVDKVQELGYRAVKGFTDIGAPKDEQTNIIGETFGQDGSLSQWAQEGIDRNIEEQQAYQPTIDSYKKVYDEESPVLGTASNVASYAGELVAGSIPYMGAAMTGIGAAGMAGGLSQEAYDKQPESEKNVSRAVASGVGQMALERLGIKGSFGDIGKNIMREGVITTAKKLGRGELVKAATDPKTKLAFLQRVIKGALWEGATEASQEALAQWGAGTNFSEINIEHLKEAFVGGATVGGVIRTGSEGAQKVMSWQKQSSDVAVDGIQALVDQGMPQAEAIEQVRKQLIEAGISQGLSDVESAAAAARTMKVEYGIDHEIFTPVANDVASRRAAMNERLSRQRVEAGIGDVQQALNKTSSPTVDELLANAKHKSSPLPSEAEQIAAFETHQKQQAALDEMRSKPLEITDKHIVFADDNSQALHEATSPEIPNTINQEEEIKAPPEEIESNIEAMAPSDEGVVVSEASNEQVKAKIDEAVKEAALSPENDLPEPTQKQKEAGNYKKAHVQVNGMDIAIENPKGSARSGVDPDGKPWSVKMNNHYGYIKKTIGADDDHVDVFIGDSPNADNVYIVDQINPTSKKFDEHKVMVGFESELEAEDAYLSNYAENWQGIGAITEMSVDEFKEWSKTEATKKPLLYEEPVKAAPPLPIVIDEESKTTIEDNKEIETEQSNSDHPFIGSVVKALSEAKEPRNNNDLKKIAMTIFGASKVSDIDNVQLKQVQEAYEAIAIKQRREQALTLLKSEDTPRPAYDTLVDQYKKQPNLDVRTKQSSDFMAYSTPAPMALLSNLAAGVNATTTVYEPTAGNGLLLMTATPAKTFANELDPERAAALKWSGYNTTVVNAVEDPFKNQVTDKVDAVLANPPFGRYRDENGKPASFTFEDDKGKQQTFKELDHVIAHNALSVMKDDGKAALILGAPKEAGNYTGNNKIFLNWLYQNYNVTHHVEVDGKLYKGQGAAWPIQMITIHGRNKSDEGRYAPIKGQIQRLDNWNALYDNYQAKGLLDPHGQQFDTKRESISHVPNNQRGKTDSNVSQIQSARRARGRATGNGDRRSGSDSVTSITRGTGTSRDSGSASELLTSSRDPKKGELVNTESDDKPRSRSDQSLQQADSGRLPPPELTQPELPQTDSLPIPKKISSKVNKINDFQAEYQAGSMGFNEGILTPINMASYTQSALADIQDRHGSVDAFAMDKLGYQSQGDLHNAFMALQADSIAMAVNAIEKGRAIVIGDQTGVGKGRQAAGVIRYAMQQGKVPVFISQKPNLFTDMYDDLSDIGTTGFKPLIMNQDKGFISKDGKKLFNYPPKIRKRFLDEITTKGKLPEGFDGLFLTYSQISSDTKGHKTGVINSILSNAVLVMDESHTAAGSDSKLGKAFQHFVSKAAGVTYLSATYAKRPDNMLLYMRTDLGLATNNYDDLVSAVQTGGLGMQTYIASKLAEAGQMVRRERSFDGININSNIITDSDGNMAKIFDQATEALRALQDVSALWARYVETDLADDIQAKHGLDTAIAGNKADKAVNVTLFSSVVHNYISQLAFGLKARKSAQLAIEAIRQGKRPVIALENTMGSALSHFMITNGLSVGDDASDLTYNAILRSVLDGTLAYSVKEPGEKKADKHYVQVSDISDPLVKQAYQHAANIIDNAELSDIPASPIDAMRQEIEKAGFTVAEITGRSHIIDYTNGTKIANRPSEEDDRRAVVDRFNDGRLDVIILNQAGSTGLSIHASEKFVDQKPRHMIVAQPSLDINIFMQMLGRVNRTGQIVKPSYDLAWLDLPSEKRPAAVLANKMSGLNANTSGNTKSATSIESSDLLNPYGDQVVKAFIETNHDVLAEYNPKLVSVPEDNVAMYFMGKLAVTPVSFQEEVLSTLESEYKELIDFLNATGQNELNTTSLDLDAKPIEQKVIAKARKGAGVFSEPVYLTKMDVKAQGKAPTWEEVQEQLTESDPADFSRAIETMMGDTQYEKVLINRITKAKKDIDEQSAKASSKTTLEKLTKAESALDNYRVQRRATERLFKQGGVYGHGSFVDVKLDPDSEQTTPAVIVGLKYEHKNGNPLSPSKWKMRVMVANRMRNVPISLKIAQEGKITGIRHDSESGMKKYFNRMADLPSREERYVMTGNLVEAQSSTSHKGRIVPFTTHDNRVIQGMLLPEKFNPNEDVKERSEASVSQLTNWLLSTNDETLALMGLKTLERDVTLRRKRFNRGYEIEMPKAVSKGKKYWGNPKIEKIIGEQAVKGGGSFTVDVSELQVKSLISAMKSISPLSLQTQAQIKDFNKSVGKKENEFSDKKIKFRKDDASTVLNNDRLQPKGMSVNEVQKIAQEFIDSYNGNVQLDMKVANKQEELYGPTATVERVGRIKGAYHREERVFTLAASNLSNRADARETLRHEILGHYGLDTFSKVDKKAILDKIIASQNEPNLKKKWAKIKNDSHYSTLNEYQQAEEVFAHIIENNRNGLQRIYDSIVTWLKQALRKVGLNKYPSSTSELHRLAITIGKQIRQADMPQPSPTKKAHLAPSSVMQRRKTVTDTGLLGDETRSQAAIRLLQDKFIRLKLLQRNLYVNENNDAYMAEEAFHGKVGESLRQMNKQYVEPIAELMAKHNLTQNEVDLYLIAKHAKERNAYIDTINPELNGAGSGMSNEQAQAVLDKAVMEHKRLALESIAKRVYALLDHSRTQMVEAGLEPQDAIDTWQEQYQYYVPLKGYAAEDGSHNSSGKKFGSGKGFNIRGRESIKAMGRRSLAESPLLHSIADTTQASIRAHKNKVGNTFLKLVNDNPEPGLWQVFSAENPDYRRGEITVKGKKQIGQIKMTGREMGSDKEQYFTTKLDGVEQFIKIKDPLLLQAMNNLGVEQSNLLTRSLGVATRTLSALVTTWNPEFMLTNFSRDVQAAIFNVLAETQVSDGKAVNTKKLASKMIKSLPTAMKVLRAGFRKDKFDDPKWGAYLKEFLTSGAKTGWVNQKDLEGLAKELKGTIASASNTKIGTLRRRATAIADFVRDYNDIVENATRFSVYFHAREQGISVKQASSLAKNLTINFNRKGEVSNTLNSLFMFANASVQGTANMMRALATPKDRSKSLWDPQFYNLSQKIGLGLIASTVGMANLMREIGGDDEDGVPFYDKVPDHVKGSNFVIMTGDSDYVAIPMPYGYNFLANIGHAFDGAIQGKSIGKMASNLVLSAASVFSPIGMQGSDDALNGFIKTVTPTVAKPLIELGLNENFFGGNIYPEQKGYAANKSDAFLGSDRTWEWTKGLTEWLSDNTGGSLYREGKIDIAPQSIEHMIKFVGGGVLQFGARLQSLAVKAKNEQEIKKGDIPFVRRFYKELYPKAAISEFYTAKDALRGYKADLKALSGKDRVNFMAKYKNQLTLQAYASGIEKALCQLNAKKRAIETSRLSKTEKQQKIELIESKKLELVLRFSKKQYSLGISEF